MFEEEVDGRCDVSDVGVVDVLAEDTGGFPLEYDDDPFANVDASCGFDPAL